MPDNDSRRQNVKRLRKLLVDHFDPEELDRLCYDLGVDYQGLAGQTKEAKVHNLILHFERRDRLQKLVDTAVEERPHVDWPDLDAAAPAPITDTAPAADEGPPAAIDSYTDQKTGLVMLAIPEGEFLFGEEKRLYSLPADYWISKTQITNAHYQPFVKGSGHHRPPYWEGDSPPADLMDHPVVEVSWHDAAAYAKWAGMRLPTEQEWEKAARGTDGRNYPWGDRWRAGRCNTLEVGFGTTTPVGKYSPAGDSPYGCADMAGNVWEWTKSWYDSAKRSRRVRGGSWFNVPDMALVTVRSSYAPTIFRTNLGFRLVSTGDPRA
jgi:serine/threonine-protein kinase